MQPVITGAVRAREWRSIDGFVAEQARVLRERADLLARYGAPGIATALRGASEDLEGAFRAWWLEGLTASEAAAEAGYSVERIRELVREGRIEGRLGTQDGHIRIRRCDLPRKPPVGLVGSLSEVARRLGVD